MVLGIRWGRCGLRGVLVHIEGGQGTGGLRDALLGNQGRCALIDGFLCTAE